MTTRTKKTNVRVLITVRRENGEIQKVENSDTGFLRSEIMRDRATAATKKAGHGEILSFEEIYDVVPLTLEEIRADMVREYNEAAYSHDAARRRVMDNGVEFSESEKFRAAVNAASAAIDAFDAEHPEIVEAIKADKAAKVEKLGWV